MKQIEVKVQDDKKRKEKRPMSIEQSLERIATALEELVAFNKEVCKPVSIKEEYSAPLQPIEPTEEKDPNLIEDYPVIIEEKPKQPKEKKKKKPSYVEEVATKVMENVISQVKEPTHVPTLEEMGVKTKSADELRVDCIAAAEKLRNKVGAESTTVYINGITAQITGVPGSKLKDCNAEQLEAVLEAIEAKVAENLEDLL